MVFLRRPKTDCLLIKLRLDDLDRGFGVVGLRRTRCEDFEPSCWIAGARAWWVEIAVKKNAAEDSGSTGGVFSKSLEFSIRVVHRFFVEFVACNCTLLPEISCIAGAVEDLDNVVLLVRLTWLA